MIDELAAVRRAVDAESRAAALAATLRRVSRAVGYSDRPAFDTIVADELARGNRERARVGLERIETLF